MSRECFTITIRWIDMNRTNVGTDWKLRKHILGSIGVSAESINHKGEWDHTNNSHLVMVLVICATRMPHLHC